MGPGSHTEVCSVQLAAGRVSMPVCARLCACCPPGVACVAAVCLHDEEIQGSTGGTGRGVKETCFPASLLPPFPRVTFFARPMMLFSNLFPRLLHVPNLTPVLSSDSVPRRTLLSLLCQRESEESRWLEGLPNPPVFPWGVTPGVLSSLCCPCR